MNKYIEPLLDYMNAECDFAYLLDGRWGSGKTYFINHDLKDAMKEKGIRVIHTSLYGKTSINETESETVLKILFDSDIPGKIFSKVFKKIGEVNSNLSLAIDIFASAMQAFVPAVKKLDSSHLKKDYLFVFDDIERCNQDLLPDLLGEINTHYTEKGYHVMLVADESKLIKDKLYNERKEKIVRHTLHFAHPDMPSLISSVIRARKGSRILELYKSEAGAFNGFISSVSSVDNIRTWLAAFDFYDGIVDKCSFGEDYPYYLQLFCIVFLTTHYLNTNKKLFDENESGKDALKEAISKDFNIKIIDGLLTYGRMFTLTFAYPSNLKFAKINSIISFIETGICESSAVRSEMEKRFPVSSEAERWLVSCSDYENLSQDELGKSIEGVIVAVRAGGYALEKLIYISHLFDALDCLGYLSLYGDRFFDYQEILINAVDNITPDKTGDFFKRDLGHNKYDEFVSERPNYLKDALERIRLKYFDYEAIDKEKFIEVFTHLDKYSLDDIRYSSDERIGTIEKAYKYELFPAILNYSPKAVNKLRIYLAGITQQLSSGASYGSEFPYLEKLKTYLDLELEQMENSKRKVDLTVFNNYVERAIKKLKEIERYN